MPETMDDASVDWESPIAPPADRDRLVILIVSGLLVLAAVLRLIYAHDLPINYDEERQLQVAREISLAPGSFYFPLGSRLSNHPMMTIYLTALGLWLGDGSIQMARWLFVGFSLVGLVGLFYLVRSLFSEEAAFIALALAAVDRHLVQYAPVLLEPVFLFLVPWLLLLMHHCLEHNRRRDWILYGLLQGVAYQFTELSLLVGFAFALYVLYRRQLRATLFNPKMYAALGVFVLLIMPSLIWNLTNQAVNFDRTATKIGTFGLSPRMLLLYLGDWMICLKSTEWWMMNISEKAYMPYQIPCLPTAGVAYLAAIVVSFRFVRRPPFGLLLILILAVSIPATVINVRESWNEFGWGSMTVFAAIGLAAAISSPLLRSRIIRALGIVYYAWLLVAIGLFLAGPKWGYSSPCWEKAFIGRMKWYLLPESTSAARSEEARRLVVRTADRHPDNPLVLFYLLQLTDDPVRRYEARDRLREVDPDNPYFGVFEAKVLLYQDKAERVRDRLKELIQRHPPYADFHQYLAAAELALGHYEAAISQARTTLALKPDAYGMHRFLGRAHAANDEPVAAWQSYQRYVAAHFEQPAEGYAEVARQALNERHGMVAIRALDALRVEASVDTMAGLWARINLAWLFSTHPDPNLRNGQRAVELAEEAMARPGEYTVGTESPRDETSFRIISLDTLAAAYAEQGRFTQAIESAEAALSLAESNRRVGAKLRLRDRLDRYRDELPWRLRLSDSLARLEGY